MFIVHWWFMFWMNVNRVKDIHLSLQVVRKGLQLLFIVGHSQYFSSSTIFDDILVFQLLLQILNCPNFSIQIIKITIWILLTVHSWNFFPPNTIVVKKSLIYSRTWRDIKFFIKIYFELDSKFFISIWSERCFTQLFGKKPDYGELKWQQSKFYYFC